jgi:hypothetical protein
MSCEDYGDVDKPHTFEEAVAYLNDESRPTSIDYEVKIGEERDGKIREHQGALMTRETWLEAVKHKSFIDYDGMGNEVSADGKILTSATIDIHPAGWIYPSTADKIRPETKYILWYNR